MRGKQAKILSDDNFEDLLLLAETSRHPLRNRVIVLLSAKAGLRAGEIAHLTWAMVTDPTGAIGTLLELPDRAAKNRSGRVIPLHEDLRATLAAWWAAAQSAGPVIVSERGGPMTPQSVVVWFANAYRLIGLDGCSSHSGRRTFITRAARLAHHAGGSLRDVQLLAGHRSIQTTQRYIDGDTDAQRKLVSMIWGRITVRSLTVTKAALEPDGFWTPAHGNGFDGSLNVDNDMEDKTARTNANLHYAVQLVHVTCCLAGSASHLDDIRADLRDCGIIRAIKDHDTPVLFDWLVEVLSFQGISDSVAAGYMPSTAASAGRISPKGCHEPHRVRNSADIGGSSTAGTTKDPARARSPATLTIAPYRATASERPPQPDGVQPVFVYAGCRRQWFRRLDWRSIGHCEFPNSRPGSLPCAKPFALLSPLPKLSPLPQVCMKVKRVKARLPTETPPVEYA
jgi:Phage integrase family